MAIYLAHKKHGVLTMIRRFRLITLFFAVALLAWFCLWRGILTGARAGNINRRPVLVVGTNVGYPPFMMPDDYGNPVGFDDDVIKEVASRLNYNLVYKDLAFEALVVALKKKKVNLIIGGISISGERKKTGLLFPYYGDVIDSVAFLYKKGRTIPGSIAELSSKGLSVCTQSGTVFSEIVEQYDSLNQKFLGDISDLVLEISYGRSDVCILDKDSICALVAKDKSLAMHEVVLEEHEHIYGFGIGVLDPLLMQKVVNTIDTMRADGTMARLEKRWFVMEKD